MENCSPIPPTAAQAARDLASSAAARESFMGSLTLPGGYSLVSGSGNAVIAYGVALGNSTWRFGAIAFVVSLALAAWAQAVALRRFQARNGVSVRGASGFGGPRAGRTIALGLAVAVLSSIVAATWLMVAEHPVWAAVAALTAVPATAIADRAWLARHRPAR